MWWPFVPFSLSHSCNVMAVCPILPKSCLRCVMTWGEWDKQPSHRKNGLGRVGQTVISSQEWLGENVTNGHRIARMSWEEWDKQQPHRKKVLGRTGHTAITSQEWLGETGTNGHHIARMIWGAWGEQPSHRKNDVGRLGQTAITLQD